MSFVRPIFVSILLIWITFLMSWAYADIKLTEFPLEFTPDSASIYGANLYVHNIDDKSVSLIDIKTNQVKKTMIVESNPNFSIQVGKYLYVMNSWTNTVSVINTDTWTLQKNILVGSGPSYATLIGTKLYVSNTGNDSLSVIETTNNLNIKTIENVGPRPTCSFYQWSRLYVCNSDSSSVAIINTSNNTVATGVTTEAKPVSLASIGSELYVLNNIGNSVTVINVSNNTRILSSNLEQSIKVGKNPQRIIKNGTKLYTINKWDNTVSVIDAAWKKVIKTISVGKSPNGGAIMNGKLYVTNFDDNTVSIIDMVKDEVVQTLPTALGPISPIALGSNVYIFNQTSKSFSVVPSAAPTLQSFDTKEKSGSYGISQNITINAIFNRKLLGGSVMEITLNNGAKLILDTVENNVLSGVYTVASGQEKNPLSVLSIESAKIVDFTGIEGTLYSIPPKKNISDFKKIVITQSSTAEDTSWICKNTDMYRTCPLPKAPENSTQYRENMICEGFISEKQSPGKRISRIEVLNIAVNMLRGLKSSASEYNNTYSDITPEGNSQETVAVIQTGLDNGLIFPNNGAFEPTKKISRIEAYALLMRGVCMEPEESSDMARAIHQKALQNNITTKQWARFRPYSSITRNEVYIVASQLADWADKNGGCDALQCRK